MVTTRGGAVSSAAPPRARSRRTPVPAAPPLPSPMEGRSKRSKKVQRRLSRHGHTEFVKGFCTPGYRRKVAFTKKNKLRRVFGTDDARRKAYRKKHKTYKARASVIWKTKYNLAKLGRQNRSRAKEARREARRVAKAARAAAAAARAAAKAAST